MKKILVETSARHVHLSLSDLETLFGKGYELTPVKDLSQPGQYACKERVSVKGSKGEIKNIIILGPVRGKTQVEVSATDARTLGITSVIRESGHTAGTPGCVIEGPNGSIEIEEGVIVAKRHIHMTPEDATEFGVKNEQIVNIKVASPERSIIFGDVVIRVSPAFKLAMHIDTDEANAGGLSGEVYGEIV